MARVRTTLSTGDLSRLIDGLEGTSHQDVGELEQDLTDKLLMRLVDLYQKATAD